MNKAVVVIDMPDRCFSSKNVCKFYSPGTYGGVYCLYYKRIVEDGLKEKPDWCPLKLLPEKDDWDDPYDEYYTGYANGWNRCLSEITGEDDESC